MEEQKPESSGLKLFPPASVKSMSASPPPAASDPAIYTRHVVDALKDNGRPDTSPVKLQEKYAGHQKNKEELLKSAEADMKPILRPELFQHIHELLLCYASPIVDLPHLRDESKYLTEVISIMKNLLKDGEEKEKELAKKYLDILTTPFNGQLQIPEGAVVEHRIGNSIIAQAAEQVDGGKKEMRDIKEFKDMRDAVLFPHDPCIDDIQQGGLGDCYLLAGLASIVQTHPEKIKECIRDNGDGTVTVRFFTFDKDGKKESLYVRVDKLVPGSQGDAYTRGSLWVQMIERAYAASGLHFRAKDNPGWKPAYQDIVGGAACDFVWTLTGLELELIHIKKEDANEFLSETLTSGTVSGFARDFHEWPIEIPKEPEPGSADYEKQHQAFMDSPQIKFVQKISDLLESTIRKIDIKALPITDGEDPPLIQRILPSLESMINSLNQDEFAYPQEYIDQIKGSQQDPANIPLTPNPEQIKKMKTAMIGWAVKHITDAERWKNLRAGPIFGQNSIYGQITENLFSQIEAKMKAGYIVTANTFDEVYSLKDGKYDNATKSGESPDDPDEGGLLKNHSYAIMGTKVIGNTKFIQVYEPYREYARIYTIGENGKISSKNASADGVNTNGIFLIELSDFIVNFRHLGFNQPKPKGEKPVPERAAT